MWITACCGECYPQWVGRLVGYLLVTRLAARGLVSGCLISCLTVSYTSYATFDAQKWLQKWHIGCSYVTNHMLRLVNRSRAFSISVSLLYSYNHPHRMGICLKTAMNESTPRAAVTIAMVTTVHQTTAQATAPQTTYSWECLPTTKQPKWPCLAAC